MRKITLTLFFILGLLASAVALADGCLPGDDCYETPPSRAASQPLIMDEDECGWGSRVAAGAPVYLFDDEDTDVGGGIYYDLFHCDMPLNFRIGAEVSHIDMSQPSALTAAEPGRSEANVTFVRVPLAVEYTTMVADNTHWFVGGGPDIINTANDISDTSVGLHLSTRLLYNFDEHFGLSVEGGYLWAEVDTNEGGDANLDGAFIIPALSYTF